MGSGSGHSRGFSGSPSGSLGPGGRLGSLSLITISNIQKTLQSSSSLLTRPGSVSDGRIPDSGRLLLGLRCKRSEIISLGSLSGSSRVGNFIVLQLDSGRSSKPIIGTDRIFPHRVVLLRFNSCIFFISNITRQSRNVSKFAFFAIRVDVTVFSTSDTVNSTSFFSETSIFTNITKSKATIFVSVRITFNSSYIFSLGITGQSLAFFFIITRSVLSAGNSWGSAGPASGNLLLSDRQNWLLF